MAKGSMMELSLKNWMAHLVEKFGEKVVKEWSGAKIVWDVKDGIFYASCDEATEEVRKLQDPALGFMKHVILSLFTFVPADTDFISTGKRWMISMDDLLTLAKVKSEMFGHAFEGELHGRDYN